MSFKTQDFYDFGDFRLLDRAERTLTRGGNFIPVTPKVFETLLALVENAGRIVEKEELMQMIWRERFVEESNLTFNIGMLRKALGDDAASPRYVETVPRRGYRFIAEVQRVEADDETAGQRDGETVRRWDKRTEADSTANSMSHRPVVSPSHRSSSSGAVVAIADWRHEAARKESAEAEPVAANGFSNGHPPKIQAVPAAASEKRARPAYFWVSLTCVAILAAAGIGYALYRAVGAPQRPAAFSMPNVGRLTASGNARSAAVSPDGKFVAYVLDENKQHGLWLKNVATGSGVQIPLPAETLFVGSITFSPDGNYLYYGAKKTLYQFPVLGGTAKKITDDYGGSQYNEITFSPDGKQFAFLRFETGEDGEDNAALVVADANGGGERTLATSKRPNIFLRSAAWSPDGKTIACVALNAAGSQEIVAARVADGAVSPVSSPVWATIRQIVWQRDGLGFFLIGDNDDSGFLSQIWSVSATGGAVKNITDDLNDYQSLSLTAGGRTIVAVRAEQEAHLWVAPLDEQTPRARQITGGFEKFDGVFGINWTTDGKIIYEAAPSGKIEIWQVDADGRGAQKLAGEGGAMGASPDGKYLVFQSSDVDGNGLFRLNWSDGEKKRLTNGTDIDPGFSPDGRWLVFTRYADDVALWRVSIDGGEAQKLTDFSGLAMSPTVSPDGKRIAFFRDQDAGARPLSVIAADGGAVVKSFPIPEAVGGMFRGHGKIALAWTADGRAIIYARSVEGVSNIWRQSLDGGAPVPITNFETGQIFNFAASRDGKQLALSRGAYSRDAILINAVE